jgi:hypothetical protein
LKINARAQLDYQEAIVQSGVFYEVAKWGDTRSYTALDVMGSARYWNQDVDLSLNVQGTLTADVQADFKRVGLDLTRKVKGSWRLPLPTQATSNGSIRWSARACGINSRQA